MVRSEILGAIKELLFGNYEQSMAFAEDLERDFRVIYNFLMSGEDYNISTPVLEYIYDYYSVDE